MFQPVLCESPIDVRLIEDDSDNFGALDDHKTDNTPEHLAFIDGAKWATTPAMEAWSTWEHSESTHPFQTTVPLFGLTIAFTFSLSNFDAFANCKQKVD